jgi:hypothetical protein
MPRKSPPLPFKSRSSSVWAESSKFQRQAAADRLLIVSIDLDFKFKLARTTAAAVLSEAFNLGLLNAVPLAPLHYIHLVSAPQGPS